MYSADLVPSEIAHDSMEVDQTDSEDGDDDECYDETDGNTKDVEACQMFNNAMEIRRILRDAKGEADWPPDSSDLNLVNSLQSIPHQII